MKIGIYYYATKVYKDYFDGFYKSLNNFFLGMKRKQFYSQTMNKTCIKIKVDIEWHYINHYPWPIISLYKFYRTLENLSDEFDISF